MSIVKYKLSNGKTAVYESTSYYDPEKKQARPKRKYLGLEDPETGELIPSSGKRGRRRKEVPSDPQEKTPPVNDSDSRLSEELKKLRQDVNRLSEENRDLNKQNGELRKELSRYRGAVNSVIATLKSLER